MEAVHLTRGRGLTLRAAGRWPFISKVNRQLCREQREPNPGLIKEELMDVPRSGQFATINLQWLTLPTPWQHFHEPRADPKFSRAVSLEQRRKPKV